MLSTSLERSALRKIWKPTPVPLCCVKAPDLSVILISLPFLLPLSSLQLIYWSGRDLPPLPLWKKKLKIMKQSQWWCTWKSGLAWCFMRNLLFSEQCHYARIAAGCGVCCAQSCAGRSQPMQCTELHPVSPAAVCQPPWLVPTTVLESRAVH